MEEIISLLEEFLRLGGRMPFGVSVHTLAEALYGSYHEARDMRIARSETGRLVFVVIVPDGLHCTEDPDPDYELAYSLGQTETYRGPATPRNAGLPDTGCARTVVKADALTELSECVQFLLRMELRGYVDAATGRPL